MLNRQNAVRDLLEEGGERLYHHILFEERGLEKEEGFSLLLNLLQDWGKIGSFLNSFSLCWRGSGVISPSKGGGEKIYYIREKKSELSPSFEAVRMIIPFIPFTV